MKKAEKPFFVSNLAEEIKSASSVVLVDYAGLSVKAQQDLKKRLKEVGATMSVVKNTLFKLAGESAKVDKETLSNSALTGPTALVMSKEDPIAPLQVLAIFAKEFEIPNFKVGLIEGKFQNKEALTTLSKLPSKEILVAQAVGAIGAPLYGIVGVLNAKMQELVSILEKWQSKRVEE